MRKYTLNRLIFAVTLASGVFALVVSPFALGNGSNQKSPQNIQDKVMKLQQKAKKWQLTGMELTQKQKGDLKSVWHKKYHDKIKDKYDEKFPVKVKEFFLANSSKRRQQLADDVAEIYARMVTQSGWVYRMRQELAKKQSMKLDLNLTKLKDNIRKFLLSQ